MFSVLRVLVRLAGGDMSAVGGTSVFVIVVEASLSFAAGFFGYEDFKNGIQAGDRHQIAIGLVQICFCAVLAYAALKWPSIAGRWSARNEARRVSRAPVLQPTKKGIAELMVQEHAAQASILASYKDVATALSTLSPVADQATQGNIQTSVLASEGDVSAAIVTFDATWRQHAIETTSRLPRIKLAADRFNEAVESMLECWASYASKGPRPRQLRTDPKFRGWLEFCANWRVPHVRDLGPNIVANTQGYNEDSDEAVAELVRQLTRVVDDAERLNKGAKELLVILDNTKGWPERIRWKLWRRGIARERETSTPPTQTQAHQ